MIQVEAAGPDVPDYMTIVPDRIVSMAEFVFNTCIKDPKERTGGFITSDVTILETYVSSRYATLDEPYRELQSSPLPRTSLRT